MIADSYGDLVEYVCPPESYPVEEETVEEEPEEEEEPEPVAPPAEEEGSSKLVAGAAALIAAVSMMAWWIFAELDSETHLYKLKNRKEQMYWF